VLRHLIIGVTSQTAKHAARNGFSVAVLSFVVVLGFLAARLAARLCKLLLLGDFGDTFVVLHVCLRACVTRNDGENSNSVKGMIRKEQLRCSHCCAIEEEQFEEQSANVFEPVGLFAVHSTTTDIGFANG
jgi:hypothetical protein